MLARNAQEGRRRSDPDGITTTANSSGKTRVFEQGGAESGALRHSDDAQWSELLQVWPTLPVSLKAGIVALARTFK
jgi:hypothetical protein